MKVASAVSIRWRRKAIVCSSDSAARAGAVLQMTNKTKTRINQPCTLLNRAPKRGCAPGVTRTLDLRIRNPLLYPAELRAQLRSEVAVSECHVQVFPGSDEIDHVCNRTCRDWAGHCLCLVAHGKSKRKRCNELVNGDCAVQVRRLVGVR